jgi:hypothetical protein
MTKVQRWCVFEQELTAGAAYGNPFWDVTVTVGFVSPSGRHSAVEAFWDGGSAWRVRFSPDEVGTWTWSARCSDAADAGLHGPSGRFECAACEGDNPLHRHGPIRVADGGRHLAHADGEPFFWLGDTAWNGVLRASLDDWREYLAARRRQGFSVVQFVGTHWRAASEKTLGRAAFDYRTPAHLDPDFFRALDAKVAAINEQGLVAAPVIFWSFAPDDPGQRLSEPAAIRIARYMVARWGAWSVIWLLAGDGRYDGEAAERWKRIGRAVFADRRDRLVSMHPCGQSTFTELLGGEPWLDFAAYQSGHGDSDEHLRWLQTGPPARQWKRHPPMPFLNIEPNYEGHPGYTHHTIFTDREVRRAAYWSLLVMPPAGITYGCNEIWVWATGEGEPAENHEFINRFGRIRPWRDGLKRRGGEDMRRLREFLGAFQWWRLRPAQQLLAEQPGDADPTRFIAAAMSEDGSTVVAYLPAGGAVKLDAAALRRPARSRWFNPRTGDYLEAPRIEARQQALAAPDDGDWVLLIEPQR